LPCGNVPTDLDQHQNQSVIFLLQQIVKDHLRFLIPQNWPVMPFKAHKVSWEIPYLIYFP